MRIKSADELEVCEEVGRGAFGVVYRGLIKSSSQEVAIKQIDLENEHADLMEVNKEIQIISECRIPQITKFMGCFVKDYKLWVIMEFVNGGLLFDLLRPGPVEEEATILAITYQILIALDYLHGQGKIHRDLKSQNILLGREGEVKLTDFGVSTQLSSNFSRRNTTVGTPYWMAPEVILNNNGGHSYKADIWSLGCCAFELRTGKPPLQRQYPPMKALRQISQCNNESDFLELIGLEEIDILPVFKNFLLQCFITDPKERSSSKRLLKHKFITQYQGSHVKDLKKLITRKQLWDQEHHVPKIQNFYVPTEIQKNQQLWHEPGGKPSKTIHFDLSSIDSGELNEPATEQEDSEKVEKVENSLSKSSGPETTLLYNSLSKPDTKQENLKKMIKPELLKILNKVFQKLEVKNNLLTEQYDSVVKLNDCFINLISIVQEGQGDKSSKILVCMYLRYFIKELTKDTGSDVRTMLQRLILPLNMEKRSVTPMATQVSKKRTQFDEIEESLIESWIMKILE